MWNGVLLVKPSGMFEGRYSELLKLEFNFYTRSTAK